MKCQSLFSEKNKHNISKCCLLIFFFFFYVYFAIVLLAMVTLCYKILPTMLSFNKVTDNNCLFVLKFYGPVNPMGSCRARSV